MSEVPSKEGFIDPNARLLASVIPPPPPTFWQRTMLRLRGGRIDLHSVVDWARSREGRSCFIVALAAAALAVVLYRNEPASFGRATSAITREAQAASALFAKRESVRPAARPLADVPAAPTPEAGRSLHTTQLAAIAAGARAEPPEPSSERQVAAPLDNPKREAQLRSSARGERHASAGKKSRKKLEKRKAKRKAVARASARSRRAKSKPTKASSPLRAWIASRSRDESSNTKQP